jgi:L-threonylcarbamoyladenylate synthase
MTERLNSQNIDAAAGLLRNGELVAIPTETVYGLGADATNGVAVAKIFTAKERPRFNPLIVHVPDLDAARALVEWDPRADMLARRFWPGPLTLVLRRRASCVVSLLASAGLNSLAIRVPAHPLALRLLGAVGRPIAAPSANRSGHLSPTCAEHVMAELDGRIAAVLDGGPCEIGIESTVLDLMGSRPVLLRPGGITFEVLSNLLGALAVPDEHDVPLSPGMQVSHYAPNLPLRLNARNASANEALLAFGQDVPGGGRAIRNLSRDCDLMEAAANLFAALRVLDRPEFSAIAVMPVPDHGIGAAINDRLRRAAAPRPALAEPLAQR